MMAGDRDGLADLCVAGAYVTAVVTALTFDAVLGAGSAPYVWLAALAAWIATVVGALAASWKRGLVALPSALLAFAFPIALIIAMANASLD